MGKINDEDKIREYLDSESIELRIINTVPKPRYKENNDGREAFYINILAKARDEEG